MSSRRWHGDKSSRGAAMYACARRKAWAQRHYLIDVRAGRCPCLFFPSAGTIGVIRNYAGMSDLIEARYALLVLRQARLSDYPAGAALVIGLVDRFGASATSMDLVAARTNARVSVQALARRFQSHLHVPRVLWDHALQAVGSWLDSAEGASDTPPQPWPYR